MPNRQPEALTASVWPLIASASWRKRSSSTRAGGIAGTWTGGTVRVGTGADIIGGAVWDGAARRAGRAGEGVENVARSGAKSAASDAGIGIDQISATGGGLRRDCERTSWPEMEARRRAGLLLVSRPLMGWSGRAPAPPVSEPCQGRQSQGARYVSATQHDDPVIGVDIGKNSFHVVGL